MSRPTIAELKPLDELFRELVIGYGNEHYIWRNLAPPVRVGKQSGTFFKWVRDFVFRAPDGSRAESGHYQRITWGHETDTFHCVERGFEARIDEVKRAASLHPIDLMTQATNEVMGKLDLRMEMDVADTLFKAGVWPQSTANRQWHKAAGTPIADIEAAIDEIREATGNWSGPSRIIAIMSRAVWTALRNHEDIVERYKYTRGGVMTTELVAPIVGVDAIYVGDAIYNDAEEGETFDGEEIWPDHCLILRQTTNPGINVPNAAYTFLWDEDNRAYPVGSEVYRDDAVRGDVARAFLHRDIKVTGDVFGYFYQDPILSA